MAGNAAIEDDVYYTTAKAGDRVEYINDPEYLASQQEYDDDYYYYGDYASRINRFNYYSPFGYYDMPYYGYSPYYGSMYGYGLGMGIGYGWGGYGYSPYFDMGYGYGGLGYGYNGIYGFGLGYGFGGGYGYGIGYGGLGYGGFVGYGGGYNINSRSRPNYANGNNPAVTRTIRSNMPNTTPSLRGSNSQGRSVNTVNGNGTQQNGARATRQVREVAPRPQQQPVIQSAPQTQSVGGGNFGGGGGGNSGGGGGGGGRPARP
ncbi:hypothetical protein GCM10027049_12980 [Mucilaginibacter puniceus]